ncbi:hypothetical protein PPOLYM_02572 [Paenibacillus polymyxa]|uniref:hypothetical protein n=1 Tax=Paenibacillus polymyxa TaxID=1406 RepID=UPI0009475F61|nr:hypothetical protein [Paenibacillus polymyxa]APQ59803.1 hypothetical protein VK72_14355 [Paenibacillus polymyxa]VUG06179.1 hypothetical protein PPOLYM_02572 [Paenibacillus polymyxa]
MRAYHFLDVEKLDLFGEYNEVMTPQQLSMDSHQDSEPSSKIKLITTQYYRGFQKLIIIHEDVKRKSGRAYGEDAFFDRFIENKSINGYYNPELKILILEGNKSAVNGSIRRFKRHFPESFSVNRSLVDFAYVVKHSTNVWGSWFGGLNTGTLKSAALFGDHVNLSEDYDRMKAAGKLSSLNCALSFEKVSYDFTITANKTVVLMQNRTPEEDIDLLLALKPILYKEEVLTS